MVLFSDAVKKINKTDWHSNTRKSVSVVFYMPERHKKCLMANYKQRDFITPNKCSTPAEEVIENAVAGT